MEIPKISPTLLYCIGRRILKKFFLKFGISILFSDPMNARKLANA